MTTVYANVETLVNEYASPMSRELAINTIEQFGGFEDFVNVLADVCSYGINTGVNGWISTHDIVEFYEKNKADILDFAKQTVSDVGYDGLGAMIASFGCLRGNYSIDEVLEGLYNKDSDDHDTIAEAMGYFVGEELARSYERLLEDVE